MKKAIKQAAGLAAGALLMTSAVAAQSGKLDKAAHILERQAKAGRGEFITYLVGAAAAYRWAGNEDPGETPGLYCPPADTRLDGRAWAKIALEEYKRDKTQYAGLDEYPLSVFALALLRGLQNKYPCAPDGPNPSAAAGESDPANAEEPLHRPLTNRSSR